MIEIVIPAKERWNDLTQHFESIDQDYVLHLEHCLASISKWEQKWHEPFLKANKTYEQTCDYIRCMTLEKDIPEEVYTFIPDSVINEVNKYIADAATATWITENPGAKKEGASPVVNNAVTSEIIYAMMVENGIPFECQYWHYNRLITLLKVVQRRKEEADPNGKKMSKSELAEYHRAKLKANRAAMRKGKK